jgi:superfamily II DNA or RNA helicase
MRAIVTNKFILIQNASERIKNDLQERLSFIDKSKKYQLNRMLKNPFFKNSPIIEKLKKEMKGCLLQILPPNNLIFPSGFFHLLKEFNVEVEDRRIETGSTIALPWIKKLPDLRDYQEETLEAMNSNYRGVVNVCTGGGKTLIALHFIKRLKKKVLVIVPSESVAKQFYDEAVSAFGENKVALFGGGKKKIRDITIGIAASIVKHTDKFKNADLGCILTDECHHTPCETFYSIVKDLGDVGRIYGLSATDFRNDGKDIMIEGGCGPTIIRKDVVWGIANGWLVKPKFIVKEIPTVGKQFNNKVLNYKEHVLNSNYMKSQILKDIQDCVKNGKTVLCLVAEIEHGLELSKQLGIPFAQGSDPQSQEYVTLLNQKKIPALIGTAGKVGEGTDTKSIDVLIFASFPASRGIIIQAIGRGLRLFPGKDSCIIYDYIPSGSDMLTRHAYDRISVYKEITKDVEVIRSDKLYK